MSQFPVPSERSSDGEDALKQSLRALRPRTSIDPQALLSDLVSRTDRDPTTSSTSHATTPRRRASAWWPALTALSWVVTAAVWWSSHADTGPANEEQPIGLTTAAHHGGPGDVLIDATSAGQLGGSIAAHEPVTVDDRASDDVRLASHSPPQWLAWLGLEFDANAGERRWEQIEQQSEAANWPAGSGAYSGDHPSATYASLRSEFNSPIGANWLAQ